VDEQAVLAAAREALLPPPRRTNTPIGRSISTTSGSSPSFPKLAVGFPREAGSRVLSLLWIPVPPAPKRRDRKRWSRHTSSVGRCSTKGRPQDGDQRRFQHAGRRQRSTSLRAD
jgi:hypothetical protein